MLVAEKLASSIMTDVQSVLREFRKEDNNIADFWAEMHQNLGHTQGPPRAGHRPALRSPCCYRRRRPHHHRRRGACAVSSSPAWPRSIARGRGLRLKIWLGKCELQETSLVKYKILQECQPRKISTAHGERKVASKWLEFVKLGVLREKF